MDSLQWFVVSAAVGWAASHLYLHWRYSQADRERDRRLDALDKQAQAALKRFRQGG